MKNGSRLPAGKIVIYWLKKLNILDAFKLIKNVWRGNDVKYCRVEKIMRCQSKKISPLIIINNGLEKLCCCIITEAN